MEPKHFISMLDYSSSELLQLVNRALEIKEVHKNGIIFEPLKNRTLGMLFEKASTRTRLSFEAGIVQLGGQAIFLTPKDTQLGRGEPISDSAIVMSSMLDAIMIRAFSHEMVEEFARYSSKPVINALTDRLHPCQLLADMQTFLELRGSISGKKVAWIGDGNNMCNSYIEAAIKFDFNLSIACPEGFEPDAKLLEVATNNRVNITRDTREAAEGAHLITTDVWASMGQEVEQEKRIKAFQGYQVTEQLLDIADKDVIFLHCLPAHRGEEISTTLLNDARSHVWQQAENRLHAQKSLLEYLIEHNHRHT